MGVRGPELARLGRAGLPSPGFGTLSRKGRGLTLRNYLKTVCFADKHRWTLWKGAADGQKETCREAVAHDLAGTR